MRSTRKFSLIAMSMICQLRVSPSTHSEINSFKSREMDTGKRKLEGKPPFNLRKAPKTAIATLYCLVAIRLGSYSDSILRMVKSSSSLTCLRYGGLSPPVLSHSAQISTGLPTRKLLRILSRAVSSCWSQRSEIIKERSVAVAEPRSSLLSNAYPSIPIIL
jgi:hypothetical protein